MKRNKLLWLILGGLVLGAFVISLWASRLPLSRLWVIQGEANKAFSLAPQQLDDLSKKQPVSLQKERDGIVEAIGMTTTLEVVETTSDLGYIINYHLLSGAFIIEADWVVLNKAGAHKLFHSEDVVGHSLKLDGERKQVVGVVEDGDKNARLYSTSSKDSLSHSQILFSSPKDQPLTTAELTSHLQSLGLHGQPNTLINLAQSQQAVGELPFTLILFILAWGLLCSFKQCLNTLKGVGIRWREKGKKHSFREWLDQEKMLAPTLKTLLGLLTTGGLGVGVLLCCLKRIVDYGQVVIPMYLFKGDSFPCWGEQFRALFFLQLFLFLGSVIILLVAQRRGKYCGMIRASLGFRRLRL